MNNINFILEDLKWSFSKLNLFDTCKYAFYLQYVEQQDGIQNAFAQFGTCCHQLLEKFAKNELSVFELCNEYEKIYPEIVTESFPPNKYKDLKESYYQEGYTYFSKFEGFEDYKILGIEKEINFELEGFKFGGFIDLVLEDKNNNIIIVDHKTKSKMKNDEKDKYLKQMYLYSIPCVEEYGKYPKYLKFNMIRFQDWITEEFKIEKFEATKKWAVDTIKTILNEEKWLPKSSAYFCNFICSHRHICPYIPRE